MKKRTFTSTLAVIAAFIYLSVGMAFGQDRVYNASVYGSYTSQVKTGNSTTGATSIVAAPVAVPLSNGTSIVPFVANTPVTVDITAANAETVTPTVANCYAGSINCTLSATFSHTHVAGETITSGSYGIQEAINAATAAGSGTVLIDSTFAGPSGSSLITAAKGSVAVVIQDNRSGTPVFYQWSVNTSAYVQVASGGGAAFSLPGTPNVVYSFTATGDQTGTTIHDISGNSNNATFTATGTTWTGTGLQFGQSAGGATVPTAAIGDLTYCASVLAPPMTTGGYATNTTAYLLENSATSTVWTYTDFNPNGTAHYILGAYASFTSNSYVQGQAITPAGFHTACWLLGTSGTHDRVFVDGVETAPYSRDSGFSGGTPSGNWLLGPGSQLTFYYFAAWPAQLTASQIQQASLQMNIAAASHGVQVAPSKVAQYANHLLTEGDSITNGGGALTTVWWPSDLSVSSQYALKNEAISGQDALTIAGQAAWLDGPQCVTGAYQTMVIVFAGTNDITIFSQTAQQAFYSIQSAVNTLKAYGCQNVGVGTMISRVSEDANKDLLNPLIRTNAAAGGYFVVDFASTLLGADGAYANGTLFNTDEVHPLNAGQVDLGAAASNAINAYGIGAASASNPTVYSSNAVTMVSADRFAQIIPTTAATASLPDCLGVTGTSYTITNLSAGSNTITFSGVNSETITGSATLAQNLTAVFQSNLISQSAAGCYWVRTQ